MDGDALVITDVVVALVTDGARLGLTLGAARGWAGSHGETLAPLALPSAPAPSGRAAGLALAVGGQSLGCPLEAAPGPGTYGPFPRHVMDRVVAGDYDAFTVLLKPYERMIYVSALSILGNETDAEDVAQEAILKAFRSLPNFRRESKTNPG